MKANAKKFQATCVGKKAYEGIHIFDIQEKWFTKANTEYFQAICVGEKVCEGIDSFASNLSKSNIKRVLILDL